MEKAIEVLHAEVMSQVLKIDSLEKEINSLKYATADQSKLQDLNRQLVESINIKNDCVEGMKVLNTEMILKSV